MIKKYVLVILSITLLLDVLTGNYVSSVKLNAQVGNNAHHTSREAINKLNEAEIVNEVDVEKYESEDSSILSEEDNRIAELESEGYTQVYPNNSEVELFLYNEVTEDMKVIKYLEPTLVEDMDGYYKLESDIIQPRQARSGNVVLGDVQFNRVIDSSNPLRYSESGVEFEYYLEDTELVLKENLNNKVLYTSKGLLVIFEVGVDSVNIEKRVSSGINESVEVRKIVSDHSYSRDNDGYYIETEEGQLRLTRSSNSEMISHALRSSGVIDEDPLEILYDLDEVTQMLLTKEIFNILVIPNNLGSNVDLIIEYQTIPIATPTADRYFRGIRSNGGSSIYPYGVDKDASVGWGGTNDNYLRIGAKNFSYETGYELEHISSMGFYEDTLDYRNYFANYHIGKSVVDNGELRPMQSVSMDSATLTLTLNEVAGSSSVGEYVRTYYGNTIYNNLVNNTANGDGNVNFTLSVIEGSSLNPRALTHDNYHSIIGGLTAIPASGNVVAGAATSINLNDSAGSEHKFDITNAISKWTRTGKTGAQVIRVQSDAWDFYFKKDAYIEMSIREMPNFLEQDYDIDKTTVNLRSYTSNDQVGSVVVQGISVDGLTSYNSNVTYEIYDKKTGVVIHSDVTGGARETYAYPYYEHNIDKAQNYYRLESNYQSEEIIPISKFKVNTLYGVRVKSDRGSESSGWVEGDTFQVYSVGYKFETFNRIMNFYGRSSDALLSESKIDNNMNNPVISEGNKLFIRNPQKNGGKAYVAPALTDRDKWLIDQNLMGMNLKCEYGFEPINFNNGNFVYSSSDASIIENQSRLDLYRYYNAQKGGVDSTYGRNWSSIFDVRLQILENGSVAFSDETGRVHTISKNDDESYNTSYGESYSFETFKIGEYTREVDSEYYIPALGIEGTVVEEKTDKYHYIITTAEGVKYYFNDLLQLEMIELIDSKKYIFEYNNYGVSKLVSNSGKEIVVKYNSEGYISELVMPDQSTIKYEYDSIGNLVKYTDQEGVSVIYEYNSSVDSYLMSAYKLESNSEYYIKNTYDSEMRVVEQEDALGSISKLEYYSDYTHITDNEGNNQKIYFNEMGYTTKVINNTLQGTGGEITEYTYDKYGNRTSTQEYGLLNPQRQINKYTYDEGKVVESVKPNGEVSEYTYDTNGNIISIDNSRYTTTFEYDSSNNLVKSDSEVEGVARSEYNSEGYVVKDINKLLMLN